MSLSKQIKKHRLKRNAVLLISLLLLLLGMVNHLAWAMAGLALINLYTLILMGYDKRLAQQKNRFRIPESSFYIIGTLFGSLGIVIGMSIFHHKTKHRAFQLFYFMLLVHLYLIYRYVQGHYLP